MDTLQVLERARGRIRNGGWRRGAMCRVQDELVTLCLLGSLVPQTKIDMVLRDEMSEDNLYPYCPCTAVHELATVIREIDPLQNRRFHESMNRGDRVENAEQSVVYGFNDHQETVYPVLQVLDKAIARVKARQVIHVDEKDLATSGD